LEPLGLFELSYLGLPLLLMGAVYLLIFGSRMLPSRETLTSMLTEEERREYLTEAVVQHGSPLIGRTLQEAGILRSRGLRVIEVVRSGVAVQGNLKDIELEGGDRLVMACRPS